MTFFSIFFLSNSSRSEWPVVYRLNFMWIAGYLFIKFLFFHCFVPVYLTMYFHPVLVSKVVSIPRFGLSLCSSLYMRSPSLIPVNPPPLPLFHSPTSLHFYPSIFIHRYRMM